MNELTYRDGPAQTAVDYATGALAGSALPIISSSRLEQVLPLLPPQRGRRGRRGPSTSQPDHHGARRDQRTGDDEPDHAATLPTAMIPSCPRTRPVGDYPTAVLNPGSHLRCGCPKPLRLIRPPQRKAERH